MFGYATDETEECMPLTVVLAHALNKKIADLRRDGTLWWARPDTKTQVSLNIRILVGLCKYLVFLSISDLIEHKFKYPVLSLLGHHRLRI